MKKILFVCSHLYSGSEGLSLQLNNNTKIQNYNILYKNIYSSPLNLKTLIDNSHKLNNKSAIYMDELMFNYQLSFNEAFKYCKFIYIIREPKAVINYLMVNHKMKYNFASRYYTYRLRRIYELTKKTENGIFLTWDDLFKQESYNLIKDFLNLNNFDLDESYLNSYKRNFDLNYSESFYKEIISSYESYLFKIKNQTSIKTI